MAKLPDVVRGHVHHSEDVSKPASSRTALWAGAALVLLSGCTRRWDEAGTTHYAFELSVTGGLALVSIAAMLGGLFLRGLTERMGYLLIFGGALTLAVFAPGLFYEHVALNDEGFTMRSGFWFAPTEHHIKFNDVQSMTYTSKTSRGRRGRTSTSYYLECQNPRGTEAVPVGPLMDSALPDILRRAASLNILIENEVGGENPVVVDAPTAEDVPSLVERLSSGNEKACEQASRALIKQGAAAVEPLREALESQNPKVRYWAAHTLAEIGPLAVGAIDKLATMSAKDPDANVRYYAAAACRKLKR